MCGVFGCVLYRQWFGHRNNNRWYAYTFKITYMLSFDKFGRFYIFVCVFGNIQLW